MSSLFLLRNLLRLKGLGLKVRDNTPQTPETLEIHLFADSVTKRLASVDDGGVRTDYLTSAGTGDVNGPAASTDNAIARFDGLTGKVIQNSTVTLSDAGVFSSATYLTPTIASFVNANHDHQAAAGGGQLSHALALTTLGWTASGHTGALNRIAGFDGAGAATQYQIGVDIQAWDADLDAIAALVGTGFSSRTALNTWATRSLVAPAAGLTIANPAGVAGDPTFSLANDLAAVEALASTGLVTRTAADTWTTRSLTAPAEGLTITNPAGIAGSPTFALANDLAALEALAATGFATRTAADTWAQRSLTAPAAGFTVTNPAGLAGNPTFVLADDLAALEGLAGTGIAVRTGASTWTNRTIAALNATITVTDGDGVAGNPTLSIPAAVRGSPVYFGNGSVAATTTTRYLSPGFESSVASTARVAFVCTNSGTIDRLFIRHDSADGNGNSIVYTVRKNAAAQTLTVTLATGAAGTGSDVANSFTVAAGDLIDIEVTKAASVGTSPANVNASFRFTPS